MGHWVCVDHGTRRIGIAIGSVRQGVASPLKVIAAEPRKDALRQIETVSQEFRADGIVVGWPLNMDDSEGPQAQEARVFASELAAATGRDVRLWDERLSSFAADRALAGRLTRGKRKAVQDSVAAAEILQDFLACDGPNSAPRIGEQAG